MNAIVHQQETGSVVYVGFPTDEAAVEWASANLARHEWFFAAVEAPTDHIVLAVDRAAADHVAHAWENDWPLTTPLRVMLDGQDGYLHMLNEALGREH